MITADPIIADDGSVHGVWLRAARSETPAPERADAWAIRWDLDRRVAWRPYASQTEPSEWSIAEVLERIDLQEATVPVLASVVGEPEDTVYNAQATVADESPASPGRRVQFCARVRNERGRRTVRGLGYDLGPAQSATESPTAIAQLVADAPSERPRYRAIVDLESLEFVYWYGPAPRDIAWRLEDRRGHPSCLHPDDVPLARSIANQMRSHGATNVSTTRVLRYRLLNGSYASFDVSAAAVSLRPDVLAGLVTISPRFTSDRDQSI
ncbi:hypothetical protein J2W54_004935 [Rhodococcus fascians]|nr:hypothetical protein [Rhodococcus sp. 3258]MDR6934519.1 hypothetical protein [Rhodococcus fascians]